MLPAAIMALAISHPGKCTQGWDLLTVKGHLVSNFGFVSLMISHVSIQPCHAQITCKNTPDSVIVNYRCQQVFGEIWLADNSLSISSTVGRKSLDLKLYRLCLETIIFL